MKTMSKKTLLIIIGAMVAAACVVVAAIFVIGNLTDKDGYTVKFELCTDLQTTTVLDRTVAPGSFLEEPEVYVTGSNEENWEITGWYREPEYETQWDFDFDTVDSDLTLYAKWDTNPQCTVSFYTVESEEPVFVTTVRKGLVVTPCDDEFMGREVLGYYTDKAMTKEFDFETKIEKNMDIYVDISEYVYFDAKMLSKWNICGNQTEVDNYEVATSLSEDDEIFTVSSKNGGFLWIKNLELDMHETSIFEIKMREVNDNYSGAVGGYILGSYTVNGEAGAGADFGKPNTGRLRYARSAKPDEDGFYTYTYNISNLTPGLIYEMMTGFRIDFAGDDKYTYEIKEIKSYVDEYAVSGEAFTAKGINFNGLHLNTFTLMGEAETEVLANGDLRFGGPNGAYIYKKGLDITLGEEQIIRLTARGDLKGGAIALFFFGEYTQDGKKGVSTDFTAEQRVTFVAGETDASGYTTYTADLSTIPGFKLNKVNGLRIDLYGEGTRTIDMKALKSFAPTAEEKKIAEAFKADGLDLKGSHFTTFLTMGDAKGSLLDNGDYSFSGPNGVYLYKKNVEITLDDDQKIELKAKGDLKGGRIRLYLYGEYTQDGKTGTTTDYNVNHKWDFVAEKTDAEGYTTYSLNLDSIKGLEFDTIHGLRLDMYGEGTRTIEIASLKSVVPSKEEAEVNDSFTGKGLDFTGAHLAKFNVAGKAETTLLDNGDYSFGGPNGAMIYYKGMEITLEDDQIIEMKAKGDMKGGAIALFFYGDYTKDGKADTLIDFEAGHRLTFVAGETDAEGYTTYTADISSLSGMHYDVLHGLRIDLYGEGTRTFEIKSLKSVAPSKEDIEINEGFTANGLNLKGTHFSKFLQMNSAETELLDNDNLKLSGVNGSFIHKKELAITLGEDQTIQLKAKTSLNGGRIDIYLFGDYTQDGVAGSTTDYNRDHRWLLTSGETDVEGYTTYTFNIGDIAGLTYQTIRGLRVDLIGSGNMSAEIESMISMVPADIEVTYYVGSESVYTTSVKSGEAVSRPTDDLVSMGHEVLGYYSDSVCETEFDFSSELTENTSIYVKLSDYLYFSPAMLKQFTVVAGTAGNATASTEVVEDSLKFEAVHGSYFYKKGLGLDVTDTQQLQIVANATVDVSRIDVWLCGTYMKDGTEQQVTDYNTNFRWLLTPDTSGEDVTYTLDLGESAKTTGMTWLSVDSIRIDVMLQNTNNTGIINIKSIQATDVTTILEDNFDGESSWTYTDANGSGTVPAQGQEAMGTKKTYAYQDGFDNGADSYVFVQGTGSHTVAQDGDNSYLSITNSTANNTWYTFATKSAGILVESGKTYTFSFKTKADANCCFVLLVQSWTAQGSYANSGSIVKNATVTSNGWTEVSVEYTVPENHVYAQLRIQERWRTGYAIDDIKVSCTETAPVTTYTQGIGTCITSGVAAEEDNVLYVKDYTSVGTAAGITAGNTYKYEFMMRNDATGSDFDFDVQVGGVKVSDVVSGALETSTWTKVSGTFVATAEADSFGFLRAGEGGVYIDDVVLMKVGATEDGDDTQGGEGTGGNGDQGNQQPESTTGLVANGDFENESYDYATAWRVQGTTGAFEVTTDPADAVNMVLKFASTDANSGVDYNAGFARGFLEKDKTYTISFKYKGDAQFHIYTLGLTSAGHSLYDDWVPKSASDWTTYTCEITPTIDTTTTSMQFYLKMATATGGTFYIDDFSIVEKTQ